jgi:hypothetical protein
MLNLANNYLSSKGNSKCRSKHPDLHLGTNPNQSTRLLNARRRSAIDFRLKSDEVPAHHESLNHLCPMMMMMMMMTLPAECAADPMASN